MTTRPDTSSSVRLLKPAEMATLWGVSEKTVRRHIAAGDLPVVDIAPPGSRKPCTRIRECDAAAYIERLVRGG